VRQRRNSKLLQISINEMPVVEVSLTLYRSFINTSFGGSNKHVGSIVHCIVCHSIFVYRFDLLHSAV